MSKDRVLSDEFQSIQLHTSVLPSAQSAALETALGEDRIPGAFFYRGPHAADLWSRLHDAHAPSQNDKSSRSLYLTDLWSDSQGDSSERMHLVSLGCGLAEKEARLVEEDKGRWSRATLMDAGIELVACATDRIRGLGKFERVDGKAVDLALVENWSSLVDRNDDSPRLITAFGMLPNCEPEGFLNQLLALVRGGDYLLVDANLIPEVSEQNSKIPESIMAQYNNRECTEWLLAGLSQLGLTNTDGALQFSQDKVVAAFARWRIVVDFHFGRSVKLQVAGVERAYQPGDRLRTFYSNRFRRSDIPCYLQGKGLSLLSERCSTTGEDGLYLFRRDHGERSHQTSERA